MVPGALERENQFCRRQTFCAAERVQESRSGNRTARGGSGSKAWYRQDGRILPVVVGRKELAPNRVQSEDPDDLHSGERKYLRRNDRYRGQLHAGTRVYRTTRKYLPASECRSYWRSPSMGCRHRKESVDVQLSE